jgi:hypothetical protein
VTTTHPKKSKVTISYPGAMLNIMVKVSGDKRYIALENAPVFNV